MASFWFQVQNSPLLQEFQDGQHNHVFEFELMIVKKLGHSVYRSGTIDILQMAILEVLQIAGPK